MLLVISVVFSPFAQAHVQKKILYIDSYHPSYEWSASITAGVLSVLADHPDVELKIFRMDTKRNKSEEYKQQAALQAKALIEVWDPDVVIASDDNAAKYLIAPYFKNSDLPFVFCGLNWDASVYGFPTKNITGMVEVSLVKPLLQTLRTFAKGERIGFLASDTLTERKEFVSIAKMLGVTLEPRFARTFTEWQQMFTELQKSSDLVLIQESQSVQGFKRSEMVRFVNKNTKVPTGSLHQFMKKYVLVTYAKSGEEQGRYAAKMALKILAGTSPEQIPIVYNKEAKIYLNMKIAKSMEIKFPMELIENSTLISAKRSKVFYVNSYHKGYRWSDDIEKGLLRALAIHPRADGSLDTSDSDVDFKFFRMNSKLKIDPVYIRERARVAKAEIDSWRPDILVVSDDNAAKFLLEPFYKDSTIPIVFCGLNWDVSGYGFPTKNMTGMVEVEPVLETISLLRQYAKGSRLGYIGADNLSNRKMLNTYRSKLGISFTDGALTASLARWQKEYKRLQNEVDMLLWLTPLGVEGWDEQRGYDFVLANTSIPVGGGTAHQVRYTLLGKAKIAEEQGWWMGNTVLKILGGTRPADIPVTQNKESRLYLNMEMARHLNIKFPMELLEKAIFVEVVSGKVAEQ